MKKGENGSYLGDILNDWATFKSSIDETARSFVESMSNELKHESNIDPELVSHTKKAKEQAQILKDLHDKNSKTIEKWRKEAQKAEENGVERRSERAEEVENEVERRSETVKSGENMVENEVERRSESGKSGENMVENEVERPSETVVNHPPHYKSRSGIECFDAIEAAVEDLDGVEAVCTGNILKYLWRWKKKNGLEDLKKARWYLNKLIEMEEDG